MHTLTRWHDLLREQGAAAMAPIRALYKWMFVPVTLWPFSIHDVLDTCLEVIAAGKPLDRQMRVLLEMLPPLPAEEVCAAVGQHEHDVQAGRYESLVTTTTKFDATERALAHEPESFASGSGSSRSGTWTNFATRRALSAAR